VYIYIYKYIYIYTHTLTHAHTHTHTLVGSGRAARCQMHTRTHTHTYTHINIHTHIHTLPRTHTHERDGLIFLLVPELCETFFFWLNICTRQKKSLVWKCPRRDTTGKNRVFNFLIEEEQEVRIWDPGHFKWKLS